MSRSLFAILLLLAGCGDLPRPFAGAPGTTARRLSQPPPARLAIPVPGDALLPDAASAKLADAVTDALVAEEVPAVADDARRGDWRLVVAAELRDGRVVPTFEVRDPKGKPMGVTQGQPVTVAQWSAADPATLKAVATQAAPGIGALLDQIEAAREESDPKSLRNRPAQVFVADVTGAPGDGDLSLTRQMQAQLPTFGEHVEPQRSEADFVVAGQVVTAPGAGGTLRIELQWVVTDSKGAERGRIVQINEVPPESVSGHWADIAVAVAREAAGGVRDVILQQVGNRRGTPAA